MVLQLKIGWLQLNCNSTALGECSWGGCYWKPLEYRDAQVCPDANASLKFGDWSQKNRWDGQMKPQCKLPPDLKSGGNLLCGFVLQVESGKMASAENNALWSIFLCVGTWPPPNFALSRPSSFQFFWYCRCVWRGWVLLLGFSSTWTSWLALFILTCKGWLIDTREGVACASGRVQSVDF